jgi:hypothetical protein
LLALFVSIFGGLYIEISPGVLETPPCI